MTTLSKRADPHVAALLAVVEGQVRSAMNDHKEWNLPAGAERSIAKRVAGGVAAEWSRLEALRAHTSRNAG